MRLRSEARSLSRRDERGGCFACHSIPANDGRGRGDWNPILIIYPYYLSCLWINYGSDNGPDPKDETSCCGNDSTTSMGATTEDTTERLRCVVVKVKVVCVIGVSQTQHAANDKGQRQYIAVDAETEAAAIPNSRHVAQNDDALASLFSSQAFTEADTTLVVEMCGADSDSKRVQTEPSSLVSGFAAFDRTFNFPLLNRDTAEVAQLYFEVTSENRVIGHFASPLACLRQGLGIIPLEDPIAPLSNKTNMALVCELQCEEVTLTTHQFMVARMEDDVTNTFYTA